MGTAPASTSSSTAAAGSAGVRANAGHPAVVGTPATSMLSFTANGRPPSGSSDSRARRAIASTSSRGRTEMRTLARRVTLAYVHAIGTTDAAALAEALAAFYAHAMRPTSRLIGEF